MTEKEVWVNITSKYKNQYLKITDEPAIGSKLVFIPYYDGMIYELTDGAYKRFSMKPGDIMTVQKIDKTYPDKNFFCVYVKENSCIFTPAQFVPFELVDSRDISTIDDVYKILKRKYCNL